MSGGPRPPVVPGRITRALDAHGLYGPEVDLACKAREPAVDDWEEGKYEPSDEQLAALAELTGMPIGYFFLPLEPEPSVAYICWRKGRPRGQHCERVESDGIPVPPVVEARRRRAARKTTPAGQTALF
jgi:transcriptional regulator with XRE-family HTH domain